MGYYTSYSLSVQPRKNGMYFTKDTISALNLAVNQLEVFDDGSFEDGGWCTYAKWYDYEDNMIALSEKFPDILFELDGNGEDSEDFWIEYFCGGRHQYCRGEITYEEPDMAALIGEDLCDDLSVDDSQIENLLKDV